MAHLSNSEQNSGFEALYIALYGEENYLRWQALKKKMKFLSEQHFVSWILNFIESAQKEDHYHSGKQIAIVGNVNKEGYDGTLLTSSVMCSSENSLNLPNENANKSRHNISWNFGESTSHVYNEESANFVKQEIDLTGDDDSFDADISDSGFIKSEQSVYQMGAETERDSSRENFDLKNTECARYVEYDESEQVSLEVENEKHNPNNMQLSPVSAAIAGIIETSDGRYQCPYCGNLYSGKGNLQAHIKTVHLGLRYQCRLCTQQFTSRQNLKFHLLRKHNTSWEEADINMIQETDVSGPNVSTHSLEK